jgi:hypothetical protein
VYGNVYYAIQEADQIIKSTIAEVTVDNETSNQESQQDDPQRTGSHFATSVKLPTS